MAAFDWLYFLQCRPAEKAGLRRAERPVPPYALMFNTTPVESGGTLGAGAASVTTGAAAAAVGAAAAC